MEKSGHGEAVRVYRSGALTPDNFTPRSGRDTVASEAAKPGLSTLIQPLPGGKRKFQCVDISKLKPPLKAYCDEPASAGTEGHVSISPVEPSGKVDQAALEEWASYRRTGRTHPLTQNVLDAVVETDVRFE